MFDSAPHVHLFSNNPSDSTRSPCGDGAARGYYNDSIDDNGWSFLSVEGNSNYTDEEVAVAAGALEGFLTAHRIVQHISNIRGGSTGFPPQMTAFIQENFAWMEAEAAERASSDEYWHHVQLLLLQLRGMYQGIKSSLARNSTGLSLPSWHLFYSMALLGDEDDLCPAFGGCSSPLRRGLKEKGDSHCR
jgi:hypothetical protein